MRHWARDTEICVVMMNETPKCLWVCEAENHFGYKDDLIYYPQLAFKIGIIISI